MEGRNAALRRRGLEQELRETAHSVPKKFASRLVVPTVFPRKLSVVLGDGLFDSCDRRTGNALHAPAAEPSAGIRSTRHLSLSSAMRWNDSRWRRAAAHGRYDGSSTISLHALRICRAQASHADPNRFAINGSASSTSTTYRDTAGGAMRAIFRLSAHRTGRENGRLPVRAARDSTGPPPSLLPVAIPPRPSQLRS
jgi:hypothetical protein